MIEVGIAHSKRERPYQGVGLRANLNQSQLIQRYPSDVRKKAIDYLFKPGYGAALTFLQIQVVHNEESGVAILCESSFVTEAKESHSGLILEIYLESQLIEEFASDRNATVFENLTKAIDKFILDCGIQSFDLLVEKTPEYQLALAVQKLSKWSSANGNVRKILIVQKDEHGYRESEWKGDGPATARTSQNVAVLDAAYETWAYREGASGQLVAGQRSGEMARSASRSFDNTSEPTSVAYCINERIIKRSASKVLLKNVIDGQLPGARLYPNALIVANDPTLETLDLQPSLWQVAHTTQFVSPGSFILEEDSWVLPNGSTIVAYRDPVLGEATYVIESTKASAKSSFPAPFRLKQSDFQVYTSTDREHLQEEPKSIIGADRSIQLLVGCVITVSEKKVQPAPRSYQASGRRKTDRKRFRLEHRQGSALPESLLELAGHFALERDGEGQPLLRHLWDERSDHDRDAHFAILAGPCSLESEQSVEAQVRFEAESPKRVDWVGVTICVPLEKSSEKRKRLNPAGLTFRILRGGTWQVTVDEMIVASGPLPYVCKVREDEWSEIRVTRRGSAVLVFCNGHLIYTLQSSLQPTGLFGLSCGPHNACFRFIKVS